MQINKKLFICRRNMWQKDFSLCGIETTERSSINGCDPYFLVSTHNRLFLHSRFGGFRLVVAKPFDRAVDLANTYSLQNYRIIGKLIFLLNIAH